MSQSWWCYGSAHSFKGIVQADSVDGPARARAGDWLSGPFDSFNEAKAAAVALQQTAVELAKYELARIRSCRNPASRRKHK